MQPLWPLITGENPAAVYSFAGGTISAFTTALNTALGAATPAGAATFSGGVMTLNVGQSGGIVVQKSALQYIENHDHERFVNHFGIVGDEHGLFREGDRSQWYKVQPYLIAMMCAQGIPMLWQGQEFGENYWIPNDGLARVMLFRPVRWDYFYDDIGKGTISLVRKLCALRRDRQELRRGN